MPMVPDASGPMYYAGSHLGLNTLGCRCWRRSADGGVQSWWVTFLTRILDKSAATTMELLGALFQHCLAAGQLEGLHRMQILSDTGTHFRSLSVLGTLSHQFMQMIFKHDFHTINVWYGAESHFKNCCDGHFSELREAASQASTEQEILDELELCAVYRRWWQYRVAQDPTKEAAEFLIFEPGREKSAVELTALKAHTLTEKLKGCHRWTLRINDHRRKALMNKFGVLTGVDFTTTGFSGVGLVRTGHTCQAEGVVLSSDKLCHTCQDPPPPPPPGEGPSKIVCAACIAGLPLDEADAAEIDARQLASVGVECKIWRGWKLAYRQKKPEAETAEVASARIMKKIALSNDKPVKTDGSFKKTVDQRRQAASRIAGKKAARAKAQIAAGKPAW